MFLFHKTAIGLDTIAIGLDKMASGLDKVAIGAGFAKNTLQGFLKIVDPVVGWELLKGAQKDINYFRGPLYLHCQTDQLVTFFAILFCLFS